MKNTTKILKNSHSNYFCEKCDYSCSRLSDFKKHLESKKHNTTNTTKIQQKIRHTCLCGKSYSHRASLYNHKKKCNFINEKFSENLENFGKFPENLENLENLENIEKSENFDNSRKNDNNENVNYKELLIQSMELIKKKDEQLDKLIPLVSENKIINNTTNNNNQFNINVFLNDKCKDALNLMDFVDSLKLQLEDLETTGKLGYVEGISQIFRNGLNSLELTKRPIHCVQNDENIYVKENDIWDKETDDKNIKKAIEHVGKNNFKQLPNWVDENPECIDNGTFKNSEYMQIIENSITKNENDVDKIIENIKSEVIIKNE